MQLGGSFTAYTLSKASATYAINVTLQNQMNKAGSGPTMQSVITGYEKVITGSKVLAIYKNQYTTNTLPAGDFVPKGTTAVVPGKMTMMRTACMYTLIVSGTAAQVSATTLKKLTASLTAPKFVTTGTTQKAVFTSVALNAKITTATMRGTASGTGNGLVPYTLTAASAAFAINATLQNQMNKTGSGPTMQSVITGYEKTITGSKVIGIYKNQYSTNTLAAGDFIRKGTTTAVPGKMTLMRAACMYTLIVSGTAAQVNATTLKKLTASLTAPKFVTTGTTQKAVFSSVALNTKITTATMRATGGTTTTTSTTSTTTRPATTAASATANANLNNIAELARPPTFEAFVSAVAKSSTKYREITDAQKDAYNPEVSNDITPKIFMAGNDVIVYDYFPVSSISNPNAETIYMVASPKITGKDPADTVVGILKANQTLFTPGSTGVTADMPGPKVASQIEKVVKDSLIQPQALLLAAQKIFTNLPPPFLAKFAPVTADAKAAITAVSNAKTKYDALITSFNNTPGPVT